MKVFYLSCTAFSIQIKQLQIKNLAKASHMGCWDQLFDLGLKSPCAIAISILGLVKNCSEQTVEKTHKLKLFELRRALKNA